MYTAIKTSPSCTWVHRTKKLPPLCRRNSRSGAPSPFQSSSPQSRTLCQNLPDRDSRRYRRNSTFNSATSVSIVRQMRTVTYFVCVLMASKRKRSRPKVTKSSDRQSGPRTYCRKNGINASPYTTQASESPRYRTRRSGTAVQKWLLC